VHIFKAKINRRFCGTVGFCEIHVCFFSVLSNETPEILLVRARDGAWTFFRSGYTPRALLISRASPFYMTVTNLMKVSILSLGVPCNSVENEKLIWPPKK